MTATTRDAPESHDGATAFTFELRFSESPAALRLRDGSEPRHCDRGLGHVRRLDPGKSAVGAVTPSSDADVTLALNVTNCSAEGVHGRRGDPAPWRWVPGPPQNYPTISGTEVGQTLLPQRRAYPMPTAWPATFTYQWLADDADISGATSSIHRGCRTWARPSR